MSAIPPSHRHDLSDPAAFDEVCARHGLIPGCFVGAGGTVPRFAVLIPGVSREADLRHLHPMLPAEWWELLRSHTNEEGEPLLRVVQDDGDERRIGVAWTEAGRAHWAAERRWRELSRRRTGVRC